MILLPVTLAGRYRLGARRPDGRLRPVAGWFDNLILDAGLDEMAANRTWLDCCQLGGGLSQPAADQTTLESFTVGTSNRIAANSAAAGSAPYRGASQITWRFPVGSVVGEVSEIGVGSSAAGGTPLFSRARIKDILGDDTAVEYLADEAPEVTYELAVIPPTEDVVGEITIGGVLTTYTLRPANVTSGFYWAPYNATGYASPGQAVRANFSAGPGYNARIYDQGIGAITSGPGGNFFDYASATNEAYVPGSLARVSRIAFGADAGNWGGGIGCAILSLLTAGGAGGNALGRYQVGFSPKVIKTDEFAFDLEVGHGWGRV